VLSFNKIAERMDLELTGDFAAGDDEDNATDREAS
jgi:hypothetical protein